MGQWDFRSDERSPNQAIITDGASGAFPSHSGSLVPGETMPRASIDAATQLLKRVRSTDPVTKTRRQLAVDLIADIRHLDRALASLEHRTVDAVTVSQTSLIQLFGIGPVLAAKIGHAGDVTRFASKDHFACLDRHRSPRGLLGRRHPSPALTGRKPSAQLGALHHRPLPDPPTHRRSGLTTAARSPKARACREALRCVKRRLSDVVYRTLLTELQRLDASPT